MGNKFDKPTLVFFPETKTACQYFWSRWQCTTWTNSLKYGVTVYGRNHWKVLNGLVENSAISHQYSRPATNIFSIFRPQTYKPCLTRWHRRWFSWVGRCACPWTCWRPASTPPAASPSTAPAATAARNRAKRRTLESTNQQQPLESVYLWIYIIYLY